MNLNTHKCTCLVLVSVLAIAIQCCNNSSSITEVKAANDGFIQPDLPEYKPDKDISWRTQNLRGKVSMFKETTWQASGTAKDIVRTKIDYVTNSLFNEKGFLISRNYQQGLPANYGVSVEYDQSGTRPLVYKDNGLGQYFEYEYDKSGRRMLVQYSLQGQLQWVERFQYTDTTKRYTSSTISYPNSNEIGYRTYIYSDTGTGTITYSTDKPDSSIIYDLYSRKKTDRYYIYRKTGKNPAYGYSHHTLDSRGNMIKQESDFNGIDDTYNLSAYEYDSKGNWVKQVQMDKNGAVRGLLERQIEYYP